MVRVNSWQGIIVGLLLGALLVHLYHSKGKGQS
jgi:hypothetical protein